jgi:hypothetical protein
MRRLTSQDATFLAVKDHNTVMCVCSELGGADD